MRTNIEDMATSKPATSPKVCVIEPTHGRYQCDVYIKERANLLDIFTCGVQRVVIENHFTRDHLTG